MIKKTNTGKGSIVDIIYMSVMSVFFYILALTVPLAGFLLPVYKIKNMLAMKKGKMIIFNISVPLAIMVITRVLDVVFNIPFDPVKTIGCYLAIFLPIEILYYIFFKMKYFVKIFDRIIITGVLISVLVFVYLQFAGEEVELIRKTLEDFYLKKYNITSQELTSVFKVMKDNALYIIYSYLGGMIYLTYYSLNRGDYSKWKISYQWLLFYIIPFLIMRFTDIKNIYLVNIMTMAKISFIVYGIKILYNFMVRKSRTSINIAGQVLAIIIGFSFPNITFILGGLQCFEVFKVKVIKEK